MIYLIKTAFYNEETNKFSHVLKIGYTCDINKRQAQYKSENPYVVFLSTREGNQFIESLFHNYFKNYRLLIPGRPMNREWLEFNDDIIEKFDKIEVIDLVLNYFKPEDLIIVKPLLEYLLSRVSLENHFEFLRVFCNNPMIIDLISSSLFKDTAFKIIYDVISSFLVEGNGNGEEEFLFDVYNLFGIQAGWVSVNREILTISNIKFSSEKFNGEFFSELERKILGPGSFETKMKDLCGLVLENPENNLLEKFTNFSGLPLNYRNYLYYLGPERIKANAYKENSIKKEYWSIRSCGGIKEEVFSIFSVGSRYTLKDIKEYFKNIYIKVGIEKSPKASDLEEYFNVKKCLLTIDGKKVNGYEILSLKE